jgi:toxin FitB
MYLLDTNIISESRKLGTSRIEPNVERWFAETDVGDTYISAMTLFELDRGIQQMERRDHVQGQSLRLWFNEQIMISYEGRILAMTGTVAMVCAALHIPDPKAERDAWIAATAIDAGLSLVTRNIRDFATMGVPLLNPFRPLPDS